MLFGRTCCWCPAPHKCTWTCLSTSQLSPAICSGSESLFVRASPARCLFKCDAHATCALYCVLSKLLSLTSRCCRLDCVRRWANISANQCDQRRWRRRLLPGARRSSSLRRRRSASSRRALAVRTARRRWRRKWPTRPASTRGAASSASSSCVPILVTCSSYRTCCSLSLSLPTSTDMMRAVLYEYFVLIK